MNSQVLICKNHPKEYIYEYIDNNKINKRCLLCEAAEAFPLRIESYRIEKSNFETEIIENNKTRNRISLFFNSMWEDINFSLSGIIKGLTMFLIGNAIWFGIIYWILTLFFNDEQANTYTWIIITSLYGIAISLFFIFSWRETESELSYYAEEPTLETTVQELTKKATLSVSHVQAFKESIRRKYIRESANIESIDAMSGIEFENHLKYFFEQQGYTVKTTPASGDNGVDLLITKNKITTAVQCKRYRNSVGVSAVQEVYTGASFYNCKEALLITSSSFTAPAKKMAHKLDVILWDRQELIRQLAPMQTKVSWDEYLNHYYK